MEGLVPRGEERLHLVLLKVQGEAGEYWDNSGTSGIKYLIEAGKAYLSGTRPDVEGDPKIHGRWRCQAPPVGSVRMIVRAQKYHLH